MASTNWLGGNGDFNNPANWNNGMPGAGVDTAINGSNGAPIVVTFAGGADIANTLNTSFTSLDMSGGSLLLQYGSSLQNSLNAFTQTGGTLEFQNGGSLNQTSTISGNGSAVHQTGGAIEVDQGTLILNGNSNFAGTLAGGGTLVLGGGASYGFSRSAALTIGTLVLQQNNSRMNLSASLSYKGAFQQSYATTLALGGHILTLSDKVTATDQIGGLVAGGTLLNTAGLSLNNGAAIDNGATLENRHTVLLSVYNGAVALGTGGDATALLRNDSGATVKLLAGGDMIYADGNGMIANAGTFEALAQNVNTLVEAAVTNTGTLMAGKLATLMLYDALTNSGTIGGAGTIDAFNAGIELDAGSVLTSGGFGLTGSASLAVNANLSYAGNFFEQVYGNTPGIVLNGSTLTLTGTSSFSDTQAAAVAGSGTLVLAGTSTLAGFELGGSAVLNNAGTVQQTGVMQIGDASGAVANIVNSAKGTWNVASGLNITTGSNTQSGFTNNGLLTTAANSNNCTITALFANAGTVSVGLGSSLHISDTATNSGTLAGAGTVEITGGNLILNAGTVIGAGNFGFYADVPTETGTLTLNTNVTYAGNFSDTTVQSSTNVILNGDTLTLAGNAIFSDVNGSVQVNGPGTLAVTRTASVSGLLLGGGVTLSNSGTISQSGAVQIGDSTAVAASIGNGVGGVWNLATDAGLLPGATNASTFVNAGLLEKTGGSSFSTIAVALASTGVIASNVAGAGMLFTGGGTFGGALSGAGVIGFGGARAYSIGAGTSLTSASLGIVNAGTDVALAGSNFYAGSLTVSTGTSLTLQGSGTILSLTGTDALQGTVNGSGIVAVSGGGQAVTDGLVLGGSVSLQDNYSVMAQQAGWTIGDGGASTANLQISTGSVYAITSDSGIASNGLGAIGNAGVFEKAAGNGTSVISPIFRNSGTVTSLTGTLQFNAIVTNSGTIAASGGAGVAIEASLLTASGGAGTVALSNGGTVLLAGYVDSGETLQFRDGAPNQALLVSPHGFAGAIAGFSGQDTIDLQNTQVTSAAYTGSAGAGILTLAGISNGNSVVLANLHFLGNYGASDFTLASDGAFGTLLEIASGSTHAGTMADFAPSLTTVAAVSGHAASLYLPSLPDTHGAASDGWLAAVHQMGR